MVGVEPAGVELGFGEAAHQHHRQVGAEAPHEAGEGAAVHGAGHHHVGDDEGDGRDVLDHVGGLGAVLGLDHRAAQLGELHAHHAAHVGVVLGQQHQLAGQVGGGHVAPCGQAGLGFGFLDARQQQGHRGAAGLATADAHAAARLLGEAIHHRHAQAAAHAELLGGEEGLEDPRQGAAVHAHAVVGDGDLHVVAGRDFEVGGGVHVEVLEGRFDAQLAPVGHRVAGVEGQVEEGVLELVGVHHGHQAGLAAGGGHRDGAGQRATDQLGHAEDQLIDLDGFGFEGLAAGKAEQAADELGAPVGGVHGRLDEVFGEGVVGVVLFECHQVADDHREHVVEVVGEAAGELADGFHLLGLGEGGLGAPLLGDVHGVHIAAQHAAVGGEVGYQGAAGAGGLAVAAGEAVFVADPLAGHRPVHVGRDGVEELLPDDFRHPVARHLL